MVEPTRISYIAVIKDAFKSQYVQYAALAGMILLSSAAWYGYRSYSSGGQDAAQRVLLECLEQYTKQNSSQNPDWDSVANLCGIASKQYGSSHAAPYFLMIQAQVASRQNKHDEALSLTLAAVTRLSLLSPLSNVYKTKQALMKMDSANHAQEGLKELQALAHDKSNNNRDEAQFYLGLYHWVNHDTAQAKESWNELLGMTTEGEGASPWARRAQAKVSAL